jgi:ABC-2 type transport system ATP-binding protein
MEEAQELSDRVGIIDHGQLIAVGTQPELTKMVGQHHLLRLHLPEQAGAAQLAAELEKLACVFQASANDSQVILMVPAASEALAPAISRANELGFHPRSVEIQEPNLEAVFLHLTGRGLRD